MSEERNWAELPPDVLSVIFDKVGAIDILLSAQYVCRPWRQFSFDPRIWKVIDMTTLHGDNMDLDLEKMALEAVDRSQGQLEVFWLEYFGSDALLRYIADRSSIWVPWDCHIAFSKSGLYLCASLPVRKSCIISLGVDPG